MSRRKSDHPSDCCCYRCEDRRKASDLAAKKERTDRTVGIIAVLRLLIEAAESSTCMSGHRTIEHKHINELKSALAAMDAEGKSK